MQTSAAPYPEIRNRIVVYLMSKRPACSFMLLIPFQHSHCTFCHHSFLKPFAKLFFNLAVHIRELFSKTATILGLVEHGFWRMPLFTEWSGSSSFEVILALQSIHYSTWASASWTFGSRCISLILPRRKSRRRIRLCRFCTLIHIVPETATVPLEHCPLAFHCQQSPRLLCSRCFVP